MVSPASFTDVVAGKLLVVLAYQLILSLVVMTIQNGFVGQVPLTLFFVLIGACFSLSLGLLFGSIFQTSGTAGGVSGTLSIIYVIPAIFIGPLMQEFQGNFVVQAVKILPTYYIADGMYNALASSTVFTNTLLDTIVVLGCTVILFALSVWALRRQAAVVATI